MSVFRFAPALVALAVLATSARGEYASVEVEKVPIDRLTKNLEEAVKKAPNNVQAVLNLARAHAMAYSLRSTEIPVNKRAPDSVWFGHEPPLVPFRNVLKTDDKEKLKAAREHLEKAIEIYEKAVALAPDDQRARLGHAWLLGQAGKRDESVASLRKLIAKAWEKERDLKALGLGGGTITAEAAGYLIPQLDKGKDKAEIALLSERAARLEKLPRPITPIAVALRDGLTARDLEDRCASVTFDADGSGLQKRWTWISSNAAWLVYDPKQSGKVTSALQLFGGVTFWLFWETGYDALAALDDNRDGQLTGDELRGLALWRDANCSGVCDPGEVRSLSEHGIVAISCQFERDPKHPDRIAFSKLGVTFKDGRTRPTFDLVLYPAR
ncbi:MAG: hypothetical protein DMG07_03550 [Acidobacteria bacterium]|nr:MAG: hypothetical protein DMG07_03550 [Acidobacteriota bacterium]